MNASNHMNSAVLENFSNPSSLPLCGSPTCSGESYAEGAYLIFNFVVIMVLLPLLAVVGIVANFTSALIFLQPNLRGRSVNRYIVMLSLADIGVCLSGVVVIAGDTARHYFTQVNHLQSYLLPYTLPIIYMTQSCSLYSTVVAAADCFVQICLPPKFEKSFCTRRIANRVIFSVVFMSIAYNLITFGEFQTIECYDSIRHMDTAQVCATEMRINPQYVHIYKTVMYTCFMAILPFAILLILGILIVSTVIKTKASGNVMSRDHSEGATMMIMVVVLFLGCNTISLVSNILEALVNPIHTYHYRQYLFDTGNILVIFNSSANFFVYVTFSITFRRQLVTLCRPLPVHRRSVNSTMTTATADSATVALRLAENEALLTPGTDALRRGAPPCCVATLRGTCVAKRDVWRQRRAHSVGICNGEVAARQVTAHAPIITSNSVCPAPNVSSNCRTQQRQQLLMYRQKNGAVTDALFVSRV